MVLYQLTELPNLVYLDNRNTVTSDVIPKEKTLFPQANEAVFFFKSQHPLNLVYFTTLQTKLNYIQFQAFLNRRISKCFYNETIPFQKQSFRTPIETYVVLFRKARYV